MFSRFSAGAILISICCLSSARAALNGYSGLQGTGSEGDDQFHLQTDEGGDRYFIYQTHNGQYRKERRLKDGSVVGTTGWVDAAGYLRLQDYIADDKGYRIYKSKTVFVGPERSIADSLKIAKSAPTDPGYGFTPAPERSTTAPVSTAHTTPSPTTSPAPIFPLEVSVTPPPRYHTTPSYMPAFELSPNSIDSSTLSPRLDFRPITAQEAVSTRTSPSSFYEPSNLGVDNDLGYGSSSTTPYRLDNFNPNSYRHAGEWRRRVGTSRVRYTPPNYLIGNGYTPQFPAYDGNASNGRGGFQYYLPKHYHEEEREQSDGGKTGSFGYVDPFGIRRVIYYNAHPGEGFQIRKNNRFVGHDATPYDPRPL